MSYQIYTLSDPITNEIRYIGFTSKILEKRLHQHIHRAKYHTKVTFHVTCWIRKLLKNNLTPIIEHLDYCDDDTWQQYERYWISQFKTWGFNLTNHTDGGDGMLNPSKETREKLSKSLKGKIRTKEQIENHRKAITGRKMSEEHKQKHRENASQYWKGKKLNPETIKKMIVSKQGFKHSQESKNKISENNAKIWLGKKFSKETKEQMSISRKAYWKPVVQMDLENNIIQIWDCIGKASRGVDIQNSKIIQCCKGKASRRI